MGTLQADFSVVVLASALLGVALGRLCDSDPGSGNFLILNRQYWVDWFARENCTEVPGGLRLSGDVTDLSPLRNLTRIGQSDGGWSLLIYKALEVESLSALSGWELTSMPGGIWVRECPRLRSLEGLEGIRSAASLSLEMLPLLLDMRGLRGLLGTLREIWVFDCPLLQSLEGLEGLSSAGSIVLQRLDQLRDLAGLRGLKGVLAGGISIKQCRALSSLAGLEAVTGLGVATGLGAEAAKNGWSLELAFLPNLTSLAPLRGLHGPMPGGLQLGDCPALESLEGLEGISSFNRSQTGFALALGFLNITSLDGLRGLRGELGGAVNVLACHRLRSLEGLRRVTMLGRSAQGGSLDLHTLPSLTSLRGLRGLEGTLPGSIRMFGASALGDLEGLQGLSGVCGGGPPTAALDGAAIRLQSCPSLRSVLGLRGLQGPLRGSLRLEELHMLPRLAGLEGLTGILAAAGDRQALNIKCPALESLDGLRGLTGTLSGLAVLSRRLQTLEAFAENLTVSIGSFLVSTGGPVCDRAEVLERLQAVEVQGGIRALEVPAGQPPHCRPCPQPCSAYNGRRMTCDLLRGGCQCPLGRTGPDCVEAPVVDVALPLEADRRVLRVHRPPPSAGVARSLGLCVPLRRSAPSNGSTAVRLRELWADDTCLDSRDTGYSLLPPFNDVKWSGEDPTQGCLMAHLNVGTSLSDSITPLRLVLAYESPSGGRYPDHLINGTLNETGDPWDHPWPDCLHIGTCREQQDEIALTVHFLEQEDCPESMELDYSDCKETRCPGSGMSRGRVDGNGSSTPVVLALQGACDCRQGQALEGRCVVRPGYWALNSTSAVPCPFSQDGVSTCLGGNRCTPGFEGVMCAACPAAQVQHSGGCTTCSRGQGAFCVIIALLFLVLAGSLPHVLRCKRLRSCSCLEQVHWRRVFTKLRFTWLKAQELIVWSWGFLLVFPEVRQHLGGVHVVELLAEAFSSIAFPAFLQCGCGVDVFGEFGILVLAPTVFILVSSASACLGAWYAGNAVPDPLTAGQRWVLTRCCQRCCQLWREAHGPQVLFCVLQVAFSPLAALIVVYAPAPGVGWHCLGTGEEGQCFFRRDYRLRLDSDEYAFFRLGWWFACALQGFALLLLLVCLTWTREVQAGALALFCAEFKANRASFEVASLLRQTLLSAAVLLFPGGSLAHLYWSLLISASYLALLHLVEPYRNRGDQLLQSFNTTAGMVLFITLILGLALASSAAFFFNEALESWVRPLLQTTASAIVFIVPVAPLINPALRLALRHFAAWRDKLGAGARGNEGALAPNCTYACLVLEEKNTGRQDDTASVCKLLLQGMKDIDDRVAEHRTGGLSLPQTLEDLTRDVEYARRFRYGEYVLPDEPDNPDNHNKHWMHVYEGSEELSQETSSKLLGGLTNILREVRGRGKKRPLVRIRTQGTKLEPKDGVAYYSYVLLRERNTRPTDAATEVSTKQLLELGIECLKSEEEEQGGGVGEHIAKLYKFEVPSPELAAYVEEKWRARHVKVLVANLDRSMDHKEVTELPVLLRRPFKLACFLHGIDLDNNWSLRTVTRGQGQPISYPQV